MKPVASNLKWILTVFLCAAPSVSNGQIVSPCYSVADNSQQEFALASAIDGTNFLIGIRGDASDQDTVGAQLFSPAGTRIGTFINTGRLMDGFLDGPRVVFCATNFLLIWTDAAAQHPASANDVYAQFVSPAGDLLGNAFVVSAAPGNQYARGAAFDGISVLAIWAAADGLRGQRCSLTGQLLGEELLFTTEDVQEAASVAYGGGEFLVVWVEGTDGAHAAKGRLVHRSGQLGELLALSQSDSHFYNPISVAYGEDRFMVVWHHNADEEAGWNLRGRMVLPNGTVVGSELFLVDGVDDEFAWANNVAFDGDQFLVTWTQADSPMAIDSVVWAQHWTRNGAAPGSPFIVDNTVRSKLGVGLSGADGKIIAVLNTGILSSSADVCARLISRPFVAFTSVGTESLEITFEGILQYSTDLQTWMEFEPQPTSPWMYQIVEGNLFFRACAETTPNPFL